MARPKTAKPGRALGPTEVAKLAQISKQAASKRLRKGQSVAHIIETARLRRQRLAVLPTRVNGGAGHPKGVNGAGGPGDHDVHGDRAHGGRGAHGAGVPHGANGAGGNGAGGAAPMAPDAPGGGTTSYSAAALRKLDWQGRREELRYQMESAELLPAREVESVVIGALAWFCGERRSLPARMAEELAHKPAGEILTVLSRQLEWHQSELSRRLKMDPNACDSLGRAWLEFYDEWRARGGARPS